MTKVDNFKEFVKRNPKLVTYVRDNKNTWQSFYELYDLYGEDENIWNKYLNKEDKLENTIKNNNPLEGIIDTVKNIDAGKLQDGLSSVQKAIDLFGGLLIKDKKEETYNPRPVYKRFDD